MRRRSWQIAEALRDLVPECPNGCGGDLEESMHMDGLHLRCTECGFFATELYAQRMTEKFDV